MSSGADALSIDVRPQWWQNRTSYVISKWLLLAQLAFSGVMLVVRPGIVMTVVRHLGYPDYFPLGLGAAKLIALVVLGAPSPRRLKEWAYAGVTFDLLAAAVSHAAVHDGVAECLGPLAVVILVAASYICFVSQTNARKGSLQ